MSNTIKKLLVACEFSGTIRDAFRKKGVEAYSCDLLPSEDNTYHIQADCMDIIGMGWDMMICHPPCTYLNSAGLHWVSRGRIEKDGRARSEHQKEAIQFVRDLLDAKIPRIVLENPVGCITTHVRKYEQKIQPYQFGDDASKQTCLWLKNVPCLQQTKFVNPRLVCDNCSNVFAYGEHKCPKCHSNKYKPRWANQTDSGQNKLGPSADRWALRSITYPGIASAMAEQWSNL